MRKSLCRTIVRRPDGAHDLGGGYFLDDLGFGLMAAALAEDGVAAVSAAFTGSGGSPRLQQRR